MLTLPESLLLLALDDESGSVDWHARGGPPYALAGAVLTELAVRERIAIDGKKVQVVDASPLGDEALDLALFRIAASKKPHDAKHWAGDLARGRGDRSIRDALTRSLVERGIVREEERRILRIFRLKRYPAEDVRDERADAESVRRFALASPHADDGVDPRTAALAAFVQVAGLGARLFAKNERRQAKARLKDVLKENQYGQAANAALQAAQAAAAASVAASAAVAASS